MSLISKYKNLTHQQLRLSLRIGYGLYIVPIILAVAIGLVRSRWGESPIISHSLNILGYCAYGITAGLILLTIRMYSLAQGNSKILWQGNLLALIFFFPLIPIFFGMIVFGIIAALTMRFH